MIWNVVYTVSMGKHGNQRIATLFRGTQEDLDTHFSRISGAGTGFLTDWETKKSFPVKNILLIEWSEVKK